MNRMEPQAAGLQDFRAQGAAGLGRQHPRAVDLVNLRRRAARLQALALLHSRVRRILHATVSLGELPPNQHSYCHIIAGGGYHSLGGGTGFGGFGSMSMPAAPASSGDKKWEMRK